MALLSTVINNDAPYWDSTLCANLQQTPLLCRHANNANHEHYHCAHTHLGVEYILCLTGQGTFHIKGEYFTYQAPALLHFNSNLPHQVSVDCPYERWNICIETASLQKVMPSVASFFTPQTFACPAGIRITPISSDYSQRLEIIFQNISYELDKKPVYYQEILPLLLQELIILTKRLWCDQIQISPLHTKLDSTQDTATTALDVPAYINAHLTEELTATKLAQLFHYSEQHIYRLVRQATGLSLQVYIKTQRIASAKHLLQTTNLPVSAVATAIGIPNQAQFCRTFRMLTGLTPGQYRAAQPNSIAIKR